MRDIAGMDKLRERSRGGSSVRIAILDGPIDQKHPCFAGSKLEKLDSGGSRLQSSITSRAHGTAVASLIFGKSFKDIDGIVPQCQGLFIDIFSFDRGSDLPQCTESLLAYAINRALKYDVDIINISGGFDTDSCYVSSLLQSALNNCLTRGVLVVSAVSNSGSRTSSVPACVPSVLAVGSQNSEGRPSQFSSFEFGLEDGGILAPGERIICAAPDGESAVRSGTSYAAAIVSGVAAALLSITRSSRARMPAIQIGHLLLATASPCPARNGEPKLRCLAGRMDIYAALQRTMTGG